MPSNTIALSAHAPANTMDLFMTSYDYDYNRHADVDGNYDPKIFSVNEVACRISGAVRNRPIFLADLPRAQDCNSMYRTDYTHKEQSRIDSCTLLETCSKTCGLTGSALGPKRITSSYNRDCYLPRTSPQANGAGHVSTVYQKDYCRDVVPSVAMSQVVGTTTKREFALPSSQEHRPARAGYNQDLLTFKSCGGVDDGSDLPPKVTDRASLMPRYTKNAMNIDGMARAQAAVSAVSCPATRRVAPPINTRGASSILFLSSKDRERASDQRHGRDHEEPLCTSWIYGDTSLATPLQVPQGIQGSANADAISNRADMAARLQLLAGQSVRTQVGGRIAERHDFFWKDADRTNPVPVGRKELPYCQISRRLENEGHVTMPIYRSSFTNPKYLPEIPGSNMGPAPTSYTNTNALSTSGEMISGQLTKYSRLMGSVQNSHGTVYSPSELKKLYPDQELDMLRGMRLVEKRLSVDPFDPHRHKLH